MTNGEEARPSSLPVRESQEAGTEQKKIAEFCKVDALQDLSKEGLDNGYEEDKGVTTKHDNGSPMNTLGPPSENTNQESDEDNLPSFHIKRLRRLPFHASSGGNCGTLDSIKESLSSELTLAINIGNKDWQGGVGECLAKDSEDLLVLKGVALPSDWRQPRQLCPTEPAMVASAKSRTDSLRIQIPRQPALFFEEKTLLHDQPEAEQHTKVTKGGNFSQEMEDESALLRAPPCNGQSHVEEDPIIWKAVLESFVPESTLYLNPTPEIADAKQQDSEGDAVSRELLVGLKMGGGVMFQVDDPEKENIAPKSLKVVKSSVPTVEVGETDCAPEKSMQVMGLPASSSGVYATPINEDKQTAAEGTGLGSILVTEETTTLSSPRTVQILPAVSADSYSRMQAADIIGDSSRSSSGSFTIREENPHLYPGPSSETTMHSGSSWAYSRSISGRSDSSSASTRSFAFPVLASEWNSSPVRMAKADPRYLRRRRRWSHCCCLPFRRSSYY